MTHDKFPRNGGQIAGEGIPAMDLYADGLPVTVKITKVSNPGAWYADMVGMVVDVATISDPRYDGLLALTGIRHPNGLPLAVVAGDVEPVGTAITQTKMEAV